MLVLVALQSEQVFHLVTEITGSNPTSDNVDNDRVGMVPLKSATVQTFSYSYATFWAPSYVYRKEKVTVVQC
jgi:hypothetical protein